MADKNRLEPQPDGTIAFYTDKGERWRHRDIEEEGRVGRGYRLFISQEGEQRRYRFGDKEPHDATLQDLRDQLARAEPIAQAAE